MPTTSLRLTDDWKARAQAIADSRGMTPHAFLVDSIQKATIAAEQRAAFIADADAARQATLAGGDTFEADAVHDYIRAKARGEAVRRPKAEPWPD